MGKGAMMYNSVLLHVIIYNQMFADVGVFLVEIKSEGRTG